MAKTSFKLGAPHHLIIIFILLLIANPVIAAEPTMSYYACLDSTTSFHYFYEWTEQAPPLDEEHNHSTSNDCIYGCEANTGKCYRDPNDISIGNLGIILVLPLIAFIFVYYATILRENKWFIQMLLLGMAFWILIADAGLLIEMAESLNQGDAVTILTRVYGVVMWTTILIMLFYIISLLINAVKVFQGGGAKL